MNRPRKLSKIDDQANALRRLGVLKKTLSHPKTDSELRKFSDFLDLLKIKHPLRSNAAHYLD